MAGTSEQDGYLKEVLNLDPADYAGTDHPASAAGDHGDPDLTLDAEGGSGSTGGVTKTPAEVEKDITDQYGTDIPASRLADHAAVVTNFQDDATFQKELLARHPDLVAQGYDPKTINGESYNGKIYINKDRANGGTPFHEQLHHYSSPAFKKRFYIAGGVKFNEGVTEYFTRAMYKGDRTGIYDVEEKVAEAVAKKVGDAVLRKAYFGGDEDAMKKVSDVLNGT